MKRLAALLAALVLAPCAAPALLPDAAAADPVLTSTSTAPVAAPGGAAGTTEVVTLVGGRTYRLFRPAVPAARPGVVLSLHGYSLDAVNQEAHTGLDVGAGRTGNVVAYPDGLGHAWDAGTCCGSARDLQVDDVAYLDQVLDDVQARTGVVPGRAVMTGYSNGGMMSYRYSCARPARVPAIVVAGATSTSPCSRTAPVSAVAVHGMLDTKVPWAGATGLLDPVIGPSLVPVPSTLGGVAALDGCAGPWLTSTTSTGATKRVAQGCPAGVSVQALTSAVMGHWWPAGSADLASYGLDATGLTWSFALGRWASS